MCIILAIPRNVFVPKFELKICWENNSDGAGLMYVKDNEIIIAKEKLSFEKFYNIYTKHSKIAAENNSPMVLHFRIGTHGIKDLCNVHPFRVNKHLAFCHNGTLQVKTHKKHSDTVMYNKIWLQQLPDRFWENRKVLQLIEDNIGANKFVFLDSNKKVIILNKPLGEIDKTTGIWYSNTSYRYPKRQSFKGVNDYDVMQSYLEDEYYGLGTEANQSFPAHTKYVQTTTKERIKSNTMTCDGCDGIFLDSDLVPANAAGATSLLCKSCSERLKSAKLTTCLYCQQDIDKEEVGLEFDDGTVFCPDCTEKLDGMGVFHAA